MNWNTSNYRQRKSERLLKITPQWVTNPETGEKFYLRRVGIESSLIAGYMPHRLTETAIAGWKEKDVEVPGSDLNAIQLIEDGERNLRMMGKILQQCCVIPLLIPGDVKDEDLTPEWQATVKAAMADSPEFDPKTFNPHDYVLSPEDLDNKDATFIFQYASGQVNAAGVPLIGGHVMPAGSVEHFRKRPGRRSRAGGGR